MLHFVYNSDVIGCLVNHSYRDGIFVLQLPITPEIENLDFLMESGNNKMVLDLLSPRIRETVENDLKILNKGIWNLSSQVANRYHEGKLVLVGDSAHSIPPAGGLGMNTGIQDAQNLAKKLSKFNQGNYQDYEDLDDLIKHYSQERKSAGLVNKETSDTLYKNSLKIAEKLMLSTSTLKFLTGAINLIPAGKTLKPQYLILLKKMGQCF